MSANTASGIAIMGATATGKSEVAIRVAHEFGGEVVSMDSRQVYRGLDIGTAKLMPDQYDGISHHLLDVLDPHEVNSAGRHIAAAERIANDVRSRGRIPVFTGGTGLYFRGLFRGLIDVSIPQAEQRAIRQRYESRSNEDLHAELAGVDPRRAREVSVSDRMRVIRALEIYDWTGSAPSEYFDAQAATPNWSGPKVVLTWPRETLRERIARRTADMYEAGWIDEVRGLIDAGCTLETPAIRSLGYTTLAAAMIDGRDAAGTVEEVVTLTQQYAKRQETFFRSEKDAEWFDMSAADAPSRVISWIQGQIGSNPT